MCKVLCVCVCLNVKFVFTCLIALLLAWMMANAPYSSSKSSKNGNNNKAKDITTCNGVSSEQKLWVMCRAHSDDKMLFILISFLKCINGCLDAGSRTRSRTYIRAVYASSLLILISMLLFSLTVGHHQHGTIILCVIAKWHYLMLFISFFLL